MEEMSDLIWEESDNKNQMKFLFSTWVIEARHDEMLFTMTEGKLRSAIISTTLAQVSYIHDEHPPRQRIMLTMLWRDQQI
jgi:hypothetical protein